MRPRTSASSAAAAALLHVASAAAEAMHSHRPHEYASRPVSCARSMRPSLIARAQLKGRPYQSPGSTSITTHACDAAITFVVSASTRRIGGRPDGGGGADHGAHGGCGAEGGGGIGEGGGGNVAPRLIGRSTPSRSTIDRIARGGW